MRKSLLLSVLVLVLLISGCAAPVKHPEWPEAWQRVGSDIGVETPEGFFLAEVNEALNVSGIYYYCWASGEGRTVTNADGRELTAYPVQIYLLFMETAAPEDAVADWLSIERENYDTSAGPAVEGFETLSLTVKSDGPYSVGSAAFGKVKGGALSIEVLSDGGADTGAVLCDFVSGIHFAESADPS